MTEDIIDGKSKSVKVMVWHCQAITWASVKPDLYCYMASLGHNELTEVNHKHLQGCVWS